MGKAWTDAICRRIPVNLPATGQLRGGLRCRSEDLCRDPAITLQEFHGVAVGVLDENGANSEIKRFIGRGDVAPMRLIDSELIWAQAVSQKQAGDLFEPSDFQSEVSRRVNFFKVGAGRHQVNRKMIPREKPVWLLFAGCEAKNSDVERFCAVHIFDRNADVVQAFDKQIGAPSATLTKTKFANRAWFGKMEASFANNLRQGFGIVGAEAFPRVPAPCAQKRLGGELRLVSLAADHHVRLKRPSCGSREVILIFHAEREPDYIAARRA